MKKCLNGHEVSDNVKFCPKCGADIVDNSAKFCAKCGNERKGTEKFCPKCGTPYGQSSTSNVSDTKVGQGKSSKKGILIASVVAVIALIGGAAWYFLSNQQDKYSLEGLAKAAVNYDYVGDFQDGMAIVNKGEKIGFIDKMGNEVIPCIYDYSEYADYFFREGLAFVRQGDKCFFIDKEGKKPFDFKYDSANNFSEGLAVVWKDGKCGYIDTKGNEIIALTDKQFYSDFSDGLAAVSKDGKFGFIDKTGKLVIPFDFEQLEPEEKPSFHEGLAAVGKNGKYGYIDKNGKEIVPFKFDSAFDFSEGMAVVAQNDKWGFVDKNGNIVIPCEYESANSFSEGYAVVSKDKKYFFIDKNGKKALPTISDNGIGSFHDGLASFNKYADGDMKFGYIDKSGKEVVPCIYSGYGLDFSEGLAVVQKDGIFGFVDKEGNSTFDIQSEEVKNVVQAKIEEKEKLRKEEEERQAEEERKRIEEENRPSNRFYNIANQNRYVWQCKNGKFEDVRLSFYWRPNRLFLYFYPTSKNGGNVTVATWYNEDFFVEPFTDETSYIISDDCIFFTYRHVQINVEYRLRIEKDGDGIRLVRSDGQTYTQAVIDIKDPLKK